MKKLFYLNQKNEKIYVTASESKFVQKHLGVEIQEEEGASERITRTCELALHLFSKKLDAAVNVFPSEASFNEMLTRVQPVIDEATKLPKTNETMRQNLFYLRTIKETLRALTMLGYEVPAYEIKSETPKTPEKETPKTPEKETPKTPEKETPKTPEKAK